MTLASDTRLLETLRHAESTESRGLAKVARYILESPEHAAELPISSLAEAADSSPASIVRLSSKLGFSGFREFRTALRDALAYSRGRDTMLAHGDESAASELASDIDPADSLKDVVAKIAFADSRAVADTADSVDLTQLERVRDACVSARSVAAFGVGASAFAATDLAHKFARIGMQSAAYTDVHQGLPAASLLGAEDVGVFVSHSGSTVDVLDALDVAAEQGATCVAVTNTATSPLARGANLTLLTSAQESAMRSGATASRIAQLTLVDIVFIAVAQQRMDEAKSSLARTYAALSSRRARRPNA